MKSQTTNNDKPKGTSIVSPDFKVSLDSKVTINSEVGYFIGLHTNTNQRMKLSCDTTLINFIMLG